MQDGKGKVSVHDLLEEARKMQEAYIQISKKMDATVAYSLLKLAYSTMFLGYPTIPLSPVPSFEELAEAMNELGYGEDVVTIKVRNKDVEPPGNQYRAVVLLEADDRLLVWPAFQPDEEGKKGEYKVCKCGILYGASKEAAASCYVAKGSEAREWLKTNVTYQHYSSEEAKRSGYRGISTEQLYCADEFVLGASPHDLYYRPYKAIQRALLNMKLEPLLRTGVLVVPEGDGTVSVVASLEEYFIKEVAVNLADRDPIKVVEFCKQVEKLNEAVLYAAHRRIRNHLNRLNSESVREALADFERTSASLNLGSLRKKISSLTR